MSVQFASVVFHNTASVPVTLKIEAPSGKPVAGPIPVKDGATQTVNLGLNDCPSVVLRVDSAADPTEEETQTFAVVFPLYLQSVDVEYYIGSFQATVNAATGSPFGSRRKSRAERKTEKTKVVKKAKRVGKAKGVK